MLYPLFNPTSIVMTIVLIWRIEFAQQPPWHAPKLLDRLKCESEMEIAEEQGVGARSLAHNISRVEGRAGAPGWD
jgi:hypothetical protein